MSFYKFICIKWVSVFALSMISFLVFSGVEDIVNTKHNLSASGPGTLKASTESRVCVFCHTPHGSTNAPNAPLWNRELSSATYATYSSDSFDASTTIGQPSGSSKLCLSCHDGALVIGDVNFANGVLGANIVMQGTDGDGTFNSTNELTGFTRQLGLNLGNDHPISFNYDTSLANTDGELYDPTIAGHIGNRVSGQPKPAVPLENDQVQCITCHNPHTIDDKFLRLNRTQAVSHGTDGVFDPASDIVCLACHNKTGWATSAHSHRDVANEIYTTDASNQREFPAGIQVWQASCLNCHDTHTVTGARMLLREGTDSMTTPKTGGNAAQEETCYQCHTIDGGLDNILVSNSQVPDIETQFNLPFSKPITNTDQSVSSEQHSITDKDFMESASNLGSNRHAECTDCHNPHRIIKNRKFNDDPTIPDAKAHHDHASTTAVHSNIISGALAGTWGVEPSSYGSAEFGSNPIGFIVKKGYAGTGASDDVNSPYVTREYQICLKCHSNYAYGTNPPTSGPSIGKNNVTQYTNQAMEFQAPEGLMPAGHQGEAVFGTQGAAANHRSWHPVMKPTKRTLDVRRIRSNFDPLLREIFNPPWQDDGVTRIGEQTMYCSDCHGSSSPFVIGDSSTHNVEPAPDGAWGPHGSENAFILKGNWETDSAGPTFSNEALASQLCFRCHKRSEYANANNDVTSTGFTSGSTNLHGLHAGRVGSNLRCTWCHVAVPHGWRNKALLVDITNDPEAASCGGVEPCNAPPYYQNAYLGGNSGGVRWQTSGNWSAADCGGGCMMGWMRSACRSPL